MENIFEKGTRLKLRFASPVGMLMIEGLWDLPLTSTVKGKANLNDIAKEINRKINESKEEDFVSTPKKGVTLDMLRLDIVKRVIEVKLDEKKLKEFQEKNKARKAVLLDALADKEGEALKEMSKEDILKELETL